MKKIISRNEFQKQRISNAKKLGKNRSIFKKALKIKVEANNKYYWVSLTDWFGEPCLQLTSDLFGLQEAIYKSKPDYIIESGVAWGGSTLFYLNLCKILGLKGVIGVDTYIPKDLKQRLYSKKPAGTILKLFEGSSTDKKIFSKIKDIINKKKAMVILDSDHTHEHVLNELNLYSKLIKKNQYLICGDTIIAYQPKAKSRPREWTTKRNPLSALKIFLKKNKSFRNDKSIEDKLLLTNMPHGWLKKI
jgi:cephalosporin hydroxylase